MSYIDHFGEHSNEYMRFRPDYPDALYQYLAGLLQKHDLAWDCGTGNGQAAVKLADYFKKVIATDINQEQIKIAPRKSNIDYRQALAEKTEIARSTVDLVTVAQALHWFNLEGFYKEVERVTKPQGILAAWAYSLGSVKKEVDVEISKLYAEILKDCWPKERRYIDEGYRNIPFPFKKINPPTFQAEKKFDFEQLIGYLNTWSAVKEYKKRRNQNPIELIVPNLKKAWGNVEQQHLMRWPIHLLVGVVNA